MGELQREVDPGEVGLSADRLRRIDDHFQTYIDDGRLTGWLIAVARGGRVAHLSVSGNRATSDEGPDTPMTADTIFRIYSMTKPITSVAALMLWEEGRFGLDDPVAAYLPEFAETPVYRRGSATAPELEPQHSPMRIWHLFTHMSGLTYGFHHTHPVDAMYRAKGFELGSPRGLDLAGCCEAWARLPLVAQPGTRWNYGVSTDVLGRLVEVVAGQPLDRFLEERILGPLGMHDTAFWADDTARERLAAMYLPLGPGGTAVRLDAFGKAATRRPDCLSGGGGLVSTAADYHRFATMLLRRGELDGVRLLGPRTVDVMATNHLPGNVDLEQMGQSTFSESAFAGVGFGLGVSVMLDPAVAHVPAAVGQYGWGGAASTAFWVDPAEDMTVLFMTQLLPSTTHPIRPRLQTLVSQAIVD